MWSTTNSNLSANTESISTMEPISNISESSNLDNITGSNLNSIYGSITTTGILELTPDIPQSMGTTLICLNSIKVIIGLGTVLLVMIFAWKYRQYSRSVKQSLTNKEIDASLDPFKDSKIVHDMDSPKRFPSMIKPWFTSGHNYKNSSTAYSDLYAKIYEDDDVVEFSTEERAKAFDQSKLEIYI
ncbi:hypothetical protein [Carp edema virus]|nr:hypothetical protein [Carp edema virus]